MFSVIFWLENCCFLKNFLVFVCDYFLVCQSLSHGFTGRGCERERDRKVGVVEVGGGVSVLWRGEAKKRDPFAIGG